MIDCDRFHLRLQTLLDNRRDLTRDNVLRRHAVDCRECRRRLQLQLQILQAVSPNVRLSPRVATRRGPGPSSSPARATTSAWATGIASVVAIVLAVVGLEAVDSKGPRPSQASAPEGRFVGARSTGPRVVEPLVSQPVDRPRSDWTLLLVDDPTRRQLRDQWQQMMAANREATRLPVAALPLAAYRESWRQPAVERYAIEAADEAFAQATVGAIAVCPWWSPVHDRLPPVARSAARILISMRQGKLLGRVEATERRNGSAG